MMIEPIDFLPLQPVRVRTNGRRDFAPEDKQRLVQLCREPQASVSGLALKAGVNANQLRKWIKRSRPAPGDTALAPFVPVESPVSSRSLAVLCARLPNGTTLELPCRAGDAELMRSLIDALWRQR